MKKLILLTAVVVLFAGCTETPEPVQEPAVDHAMQIKAEFLHAWDNYKTYAWGYDELKPLSKTGRNWHADGMALTPIDALDTLWLMGEQAEVDAIVILLKEKLNFDIDEPVKHFEIVIRVLGGLISAYQITEDPALLAFAIDLADRMLPVFDSPTGMPYQNINLATGEPSGNVSNPAEIGTVQLEYGMMTRLTQNPIYWEKARKAAMALYNLRGKTGLAGTLINVESGEWVNPHAHITAMIDSWYEYLYKCAVLFDDAEMMQMYEDSKAAILEYLYEENGDGSWFRDVNMDTGELTVTRWTALGAFMPGMLAFSGELDIAEKVQATNYGMWLKYDIEPESVNYTTGEVYSPVYVLRPEIMESAWYLYRLTGKDIYREMNAHMFESIRQYCRVDSGYAQLVDVRTKEKGDRMESFFLAETLKYLYLTFDDEANDRVKDTVFNTEAHPFWKR